MPRYFYGENAGRPISAGGRTYAFEILAVAGGTQQGVIAVPDDEVAVFLSVAAKWVEEITAETYAAELEKKKDSRRLRPTPDSVPPPRPGPPLKGRGAVVVDGATRTVKTDEGLPETLDEAVLVQRAEPPVPEPSVNKTSDSKRKNHREKRGT